ncbi:Alpha/Beta hydrolase protein [Syncephalis plumigaleata]|nr:Alpha/Beta hydrolase protein [Syncephalis plumigaleata]
MLMKQPLLLVFTALLATSQLTLVESNSALTHLMPDGFQYYVRDLTCRAYRAQVTASYLYKTMLRQSAAEAGSSSPRSDVADDLYKLIQKSDTRHQLKDTHPALSSDMEMNKANMITMNLIHRFAFYSSVAYCRDQNTAQNIANVKVGKVQNGEEPVVTPAYGYRITHWYDKEPVAHYVAVNPIQKTIVLSFRGSINLRNYIDAVDAVWIHPDDELFTRPSPSSGEGIANDIPLLPKKARQFRGYNRAAAKQVKIGVAKLVEQYQQHQDYSVVITGHSLGGTVAHLAATYARLRYRRVLPLSALYTFGKPIFSNGLFADWTIQLIRPAPVIHVTSKNDIVPVLWLEDDPDIPERYQMRHGQGTIEVYSYKPDQPKAAICRGHADRRCSTGQDCEDSKWTNHNIFVGMRISGRICKLGQRSSGMITRTTETAAMTTTTTTATTTN